jgi:hypothetical protein
VQDCKIGSYDLSLEAGGLLSATVNGTGGLITALSAGAMSNIAADPLAWYEFSITRGGSAYDTVRSFRFSVNHNVDVQPTIRASPAAFKRGWDFQTEGNIAVTGEITRFIRSGVDLQANTQAGVAMVLAGVDIAGGGSPNSITATFAGVKLGAETFAGEIEGDLMWTQPFTATSVVLS